MEKEEIIDGPPKREPPKNFMGQVKRAFELMSIEPALLIHMTASFLANIIITDLLYFQSCTVNLGYNVTYCERMNRSSEQEVAGYVADINIWRQVIDNAPPVIYVLFLGAWSDVYGRKLPILMTMLGYIIRYMCLCICIYYPNTSAQWVAVASSVPVAITGGRTAISMALYSYVADTTSIADRTFRTGIMTAVRTFGKSAGSALGGVLKDKGKSYAFIFAVGGGLDLFAFAYTLFIIKNTRKENVDRSRKTSKIMKDIFNFRNVIDSAKAFFKKREMYGRLKLILLVIILITTMAPMQGEETNLQQFVRNQEGLRWGTGEYGYYNTFRMLTAFIGGVVTLGILVKFLKVNDSLLGILSCISQIAGSLMYAWADSDLLMYLAPVVDILNGSMIIATRSMISKIVPRSEIGKVNAFVGTIDTTTPLYANPIYAAIWKVTLKTFTGAIFFVSAGVTIPPLIIFIIFYCLFENKTNKQNEPQPLESSSSEPSVHESEPE